MDRATVQSTFLDIPLIPEKRLPLHKRNDDGGSSRRPAKPLAERHATRNKRVAFSTAATVIAESNVGVRGQTVRAWRIEACRRSGIDCTRTTARAPDPVSAVDDHDVSAGAFVEPFDGLADECEGGRRGGEPGQHLGVGHDGAFLENVTLG